MTEHFSLTAPSIRLAGIVKGPAKEIPLRLLLDTGAVRTILTWETAVGCGYDPAVASKRIPIVTASGYETCPEIILSQITFLQRRLHNIPVLCHPLPAELRVDGIVGLDFFRGTKLTIDFRTGEVSLDV
jgi:hypothetical protein